MGFSPPIYLFCPSMHNSGSSKLIYALGDCQNVSLLRWTKTTDSIEGSAAFRQHPELGPYDVAHGVNRLLTLKPEVFESEAFFNWPAIKANWDARWDANKPIHAQKSPVHDILQLDNMVKWFQPLNLIFIVRDPFAVCEGMRTRVKENGFDYDVATCANHYLKCAKKILDHLGKYVECSMLLHYEKITEDGEKESQRVRDFMPGLLDDFAFVDWKSDSQQKHERLTDLEQNKIREVLNKDINTIERLEYAAFL